MDIAVWCVVAGALSLGFLVESAVGFGSALLGVSLAAQALPLEQLFPVFQPLSLALSAVMVWRARNHVHTKLLVRTVLPWMGPGLLLGMWLFRFQPRWLLVVLGVVVFALALYELVKTWRQQPPPQLPQWAGRLVLFAAGVSHGLFGVSGPPVVLVVGHHIADKQVFRATLSALWGVLCVVLVVGYALEGTLTTASMTTSLSLVPPLAVAYWLGDKLHHRVPQHQFRLAICGLLLLAGAMLVVRNAHALAPS
jgi:uncharacterized protein